MRASSTESYIRVKSAKNAEVVYVCFTVTGSLVLLGKTVNVKMERFYSALETIKRL